MLQSHSFVHCLWGIEGAEKSRTVRPPLALTAPWMRWTHSCPPMRQGTGRRRDPSLTRGSGSRGGGAGSSKEGLSQLTGLPSTKESKPVNMGAEYCGSQSPPGGAVPWLPGPREAHWLRTTPSGSTAGLQAALAASRAAGGQGDRRLSCSAEDGSQGGEEGASAQP